MEISKSKTSESRKENWITIRSTLPHEEYLVIHITNAKIDWIKKGDTLNIMVIE